MINSNFETTDFCLASTLACIGFLLEKVDRTNPERAIFIFSKNNKLEKAIEKFWRKEMRVDPLAFNAAQRELKNRIYGPSL